ncbi:MAG TPA: hypothetical protein VG273_06105 [Bryobacteraceae bacterium]|nr:hypothetical protein [Bryobacteraceae bacterium]
MNSCLTTVLLLAILLAACGPAPPPAKPLPPPDPTTEAWYAPAVAKLADLDRQAETAFHKNDRDKAAALIEQAKPVSARLLAAPHPTLEAMEAASDLDQLYGQMLFTNRNYGWARLFFQKNTSRWKIWKPQTPETARRLKLAEDGIAACDAKI